ncbi:sensor histidine kinase [Halorubrum aethiopicum]|uniref:sensor histidine kinase n=1 Tax=Halorubrum aethiopicum TaxID=1758255 RepID=UPI000830003E|nr:HAMP domain-containing sensor histidine kinase [Halorubrum aethiopicum]
MSEPSTDPSDESPIEVAYLPGTADGAEGTRPSPGELSVGGVESFGSIAALEERGIATVDCVVASLRLADGTAVDLLDALAGRADPPPVVLLVPVEDGSIPVEAVESAFDAVVPIRPGADSGAVADRIDRAVRRTLPPRSPRIDPTFARRLAGDADGESDADPAVDTESAAASGSVAGLGLDDWKTRVLDQLFTEIPLHMFVKDRTARNVMVSEATVGRRIHRFSDEYLGRRDVDGVVPIEEGREPYLDDLSVLRTGDPILEKEEHYPTSDRWFLTSKVPLRDDDGRVVGVVGVAQEITAQKHRERQLETVNHLVRHTMRNDLNAISGWIEMLREDDGDSGADAPADGESTGRILDRVQRIADELCGKIDKQQAVVDVLAAPSEAEPRDLSRLVRRETAALEETYGAATIRADVADGVSAVATDDVGRVLAELVENAVVHAERTDPRVEVVLENGGDEAVLRVLDRCPPIPIDEREVLTGTRPIDQLNHSSGLGLWMARWIVENADGTIDFRVRDGGGNEVVVTLPRAT